MDRKATGFLCGFYFLIVITFSVGCSEEPTSIGVGLLPTQDLVRIDTMTVTSATGSSRKKPVNTGSSSNLLIGRALGYEARAILKFTSIPDTLLGLSRLSANLILKASYRFGDPQNFLSFTVHKVRKGWTEYGVILDSVTTDFYDPAAHGSFSGVISDTDSVTVPLDSALVRSLLDTAATGSKEGIILLPSSEASTIVGFHSFQTSNGPRLQISYSRGETQGSATLSAGSDAYVVNVENIVPDPGLLYVQSGVTYQSVLAFSFPEILQHTGIHQALLELTLNRSTSILTRSVSDSLIAFYRIKEDSVDAGSIVVGQRADTSSNVYVFKVTPYVQRWISGRVNTGIQIEPLSLVSGLDLFTFYSTSAEVSVRPRLRIIYSRPL